MSDRSTEAASTSRGAAVMAPACRTEGMAVIRRTYGVRTIRVVLLTPRPEQRLRARTQSPQQRDRRDLLLGQLRPADTAVRASVPARPAVDDPVGGDHQVHRRV